MTTEKMYEKLAICLTRHQDVIDTIESSISMNVSNLTYESVKIVELQRARVSVISSTLEMMESGNHPEDIRRSLQSDMLSWCLEAHDGVLSTAKMQATAEVYMMLTGKSD